MISFLLKFENHFTCMNFSSLHYKNSFGESKRVRKNTESWKEFSGKNSGAVGIFRDETNQQHNGHKAGCCKAFEMVIHGKTPCFDAHAQAIFRRRNWAITFSFFRFHRNTTTLCVACAVSVCKRIK